MSKKVLIVEDEEGIANAFKKQLTMIAGFEVDIASGGKEGLAKMEANQYDIVLLDLVMPEIDGVEVLKSVTADKPKYHDPKVIILTNVTSDDIKSKVNEYNVKGIYVKTDIEPTQLIEAINSASQ